MLVLHNLFISVYFGGYANSSDHLFLVSIKISVWE